MNKRYSHVATSGSACLSRGFTLIELMIVFTLMGLIVAGGVVSYSSYNQRQGLQTAGADVVNVLTSAKAKSISQVKPQECSGKTLDGYQVKMSISGADYFLQAVCSGSIYPIATKSLPRDVVFGTGTMQTIFFAVSTGISSTPGNVVIISGTASKTITIDNSGTIQTQ